MAVLRALQLKLTIRPVVEDATGDGWASVVFMSVGLRCVGQERWARVDAILNLPQRDVNPPISERLERVGERHREAGLPGEHGALEPDFAHVVKVSEQAG